MKTYLGDSVYAEFDGCGIILTTDNGCGPSNTIIMEPEVCAALVTFFEECYGKKDVTYFTEVKENYHGQDVYANKAQLDKLNQMCNRYEEKPTKAWIEVGHDSDTLFVQFSNILIGIEKDGHAHS